jgi:hypothetical protein
MLTHLVLPAVQHASPAVRKDALRCLGLHMLVGGAEAELLRLLRAALIHEAPGEHQSTPTERKSTHLGGKAKALLDLAVCVHPY